MYNFFVNELRVFPFIWWPCDRNEYNANQPLPEFPNDREESELSVHFYIINWDMIVNCYSFVRFCVEISLSYLHQSRNSQLGFLV